MVRPPEPRTITLEGVLGLRLGLPSEGKSQKQETGAKDWADTLTRAGCQVSGDGLWHGGDVTGVATTCQEHIKQALQVLWTGSCLWVELHCVVGQRRVGNAFVGAVVLVGEDGYPVCRETRWIHGKACRQAKVRSL
jgi:hypothetical protein